MKGLSEYTHEWEEMKKEKKMADAKINKIKLYCTCECGTEFTADEADVIACPFCMREYHYSILAWPYELRYRGLPMFDDEDVEL